MSEMVTMKCGCRFPSWKAGVLNWLLKHEFIWLYDLLHGPIQRGATPQLELRLIQGGKV